MSEEDTIRKIVNEELDKREMEKYRKEADAMYWKSLSRSAVYGFSPPIAPPWHKKEKV